MERRDGPMPVTSSYEPPRLAVLGTLYELTLSGDWPCVFSKTIGKPDYWQRIPISNCSA
jgi:hypothetical protein